MKIVRQLEPTRWKTFVDENPYGNIFHTPEMFDVFARTKGHQPELWATVDDRGNPLALLPLVKLTLLNGPLRFLTTRAVCYGSVLAAPNEQGKAALNFLLDHYKKETSGNALFTELRNMVDIQEVQSVLDEHGFVYEDHLNFISDLTLPEDALWRKISKRKRETIRAAQNRGTTIEEMTDPAKFDIAYRFLQDVYARVHIPLADASLFRSAFNILAPRGMFKILLARVGEKYAGSLFLLTYHGRILYWYIGANRAMSANAPSEVLVWHAMQWGKANDYSMFDFGGGGKPTEPYGPREFKSRFGGTQVNFGRHLRVHSLLRLKLSQVGYQLYRRSALFKASVSTT